MATCSVAHAHASTSAGESDETLRYEEVTVELNETPVWVQIYRVARPESPRWPSDLGDPAAREDIRRMTLQILEVESPITPEMLLRRIRLNWRPRGGRAGGRIQQQFEIALKFLQDWGQIRRSGNAISLAGDHPIPVRTADPDRPDTERAVSDIPDPELQEAVRNLINDARVATYDELTRFVAQIFGWKRRGGDIADKIDSAIQELSRRGEIDIVGDQVRIRG